MSDTLSMGQSVHERLDRLAAISADPQGLTRVFMSPEHRRANDLVLDWMREAGMDARVDAIGNVVGRYESAPPGAPALMLGSHLDSVRDAGRYDGPLGVVTAIACVDALRRQGKRFSFAIEVIGFSDEEGTRFGAALLGSRAIAGTFDPAVLQIKDDQGITMAEAIRAFGLDPDRISTAARKREEILAYIELHIEQGPVLEQMDLPVGCVTAINGATRSRVELQGETGHAGTVPMDRRKDALAASAECILAIERRARQESGIVGTVGRLDVASGAVNVIPGLVSFTIDLRTPDDAQRMRLVNDVAGAIAQLAQHRGVLATIAKTHETAAAPCAPWLIRQIEAAIAAEGFRPTRLSSGAGHDGMAMIGIADIGMIFLRCKGGISHSPNESITVGDADVGARILLRFIECFAYEGDRAKA